MSELRALCVVQDAPVGHWRGGPLDLSTPIKYEGRPGRVVLLLGPPDAWAHVQVELEPYGPVGGEMVLLKGEDTNRVERVEPSSVQGD